MPTSKSKAKMPSGRRAYILLQKSYGLKKPDQIKARILFTHIEQIVLRLFGNNHRNRKLKADYEHQWRVIEAEENRAILNPPTSAIRRNR